VFFIFISEIKIILSIVVFFFSIRDFLPKEYVKIKNVEKRIFLVSFYNQLNWFYLCNFFISKEHKKHNGLSELDGKVKYTQLCRSLRTYGVTFFLVKVKQIKENFENNLFQI